MTRRVLQVTSLLPGGIQPFDGGINAFVGTCECHPDETVPRCAVEHPGPDDDSQFGETPNCFPCRLSRGGPKIQACFGLVDLQAEIPQRWKYPFAASPVKVFLCQHVFR